MILTPLHQRDPHAERKAESLASVEECQTWIAECRRRGDEAKAQLGVRRLAEIRKTRVRRAGQFSEGLMR